MQAAVTHILFQNWIYWILDTGYFFFCDNEAMVMMPPPRPDKFCNSYTHTHTWADMDMQVHDLRAVRGEDIQYVCPAQTHTNKMPAGTHTHTHARTPKINGGGIVPSSRSGSEVQAPHTHTHSYTHTRLQRKKRRKKKSTKADGDKSALTAALVPQKITKK